MWRYHQTGCWTSIWVRLVWKEIGRSCKICWLYFEILLPYALITIASQVLNVLNEWDILHILPWLRKNARTDMFKVKNLTHWGRMTHICVGKLSIIGSDNGLSPGRRQAITRTNAGILLIGPLGTNFSEILIGIQIFSIKEMQLKMSSAKWRPFWLGLKELKNWL